MLPTANNQLAPPTNWLRILQAGRQFVVVEPSADLLKNKFNAQLNLARGVGDVRFEEVLRSPVEGRVRSRAGWGGRLRHAGKAEGCDMYRIFGDFVPEWESAFTTSRGVVLCSMIDMENH